MYRLLPYRQRGIPLQRVMHSAASVWAYGGKSPDFRATHQMFLLTETRRIGRRKHPNPELPDGTGFGALLPNRPSELSRWRGGWRVVV
jgi:hypothetical protein